MTLQAVIMLGIKLSIVLSVFGLGLQVTLPELTYLFRNPGRFAKSILAIDIVMPLFVLLVLAVTDLPGPVKIALAALSVSPVPPMMPKKTIKAGGQQRYAVGLLVAVSLIALVFVPLSVELMGRLKAGEAHIPVSTVALLMATMIFAPLLVGFAVRGIRPALAEHAAKPVAAFAGILLILCVLPVLRGALPQIRLLVGDGALAACAGFVLVGLAVGHFLGGPDDDDRTVLAIATASRHPGVAIAIGASNFPAQKLVVPAVLMYLLVGALVSFPYVFWRKRRAAGLHASIAAK
jgi:bile acid:Na+ symporter, BASS family